MWRMPQSEPPRDYVIATGKTVSLDTFVGKAFAPFSLDWRAHVRTDATWLRPSDITYGAADASLAATELGWKAEYGVLEVITAMCEGASGRI